MADEQDKTFLTGREITETIDTGTSFPGIMQHHSEYAARFSVKDAKLMAEYYTRVAVGHEITAKEARAVAELYAKRVASEPASILDAMEGDHVDVRARTIEAFNEAIGSLDEVVTFECDYNRSGLSMVRDRIGRITGMKDSGERSIVFRITGKVAAEPETRFPGLR